MSGNGSLDFLNMIKNAGSSDSRKPGQKSISNTKSLNGTKSGNSTKSKGKATSKVPEQEPVEAAKAQPRKEGLLDSDGMIAVIDTETNWQNEVMSLGVALGDVKTFRCIGRRYYIFEPECRVGSMFSNVVHLRGVDEITCTRDEAIADLGQYLMDSRIAKIFAYNAKFDYGHLPELRGFEWYDIMRIAAYRQFNKAIPESIPCYKTGRLKTNYGVEPIMQMLSGDRTYREVHNAVMDAVDELKIIELLQLGLDVYDIARI